MRIISKFKDYYDYLRGIYGEDEKLTLDRTEFTQNILHSSPNGVLDFFVCDMNYQALLKDGKIYWGEDIAQFSKEPKYWFYYRHALGKKEDYYHVDIQKSKFNSETLVISKLPQPTQWNEKLACPILIRDLKYDRDVQECELNVFPILKEYDFHKVMDPTAIWIALSTWLAKPKEILDTQTDKEKVISAGFDIKTSFRNM